MGKNRVIWIDILTALAMIAVLILHSGGIVWKLSVFQTIAWNISLIWQVLFIWCVPILFMLSGVKMLGYRTRYSTKNLFKKRIVKVVIPFVFWSVITFILTNPFTDILSYLKKLSSDFLTGSINPIYWYFYALIGLYILLPLLSLIIMNASKRLLQYILGMNFIFQIMIPFMCEVLHLNMIDFELWKTYMIIAPYTGLFLLGYYLVKFPISKNAYWWILVAGGITVIPMFLWIRGAALSTGEIPTYLYSYNSPYCWLLSIIVFETIRRIFEQKQISFKIEKIILLVSNMSLGIYIIHQFVKQFLFILVPNLEYNILFVIIGWIPIIILTIIIVWIIKKIPIIKNLLP